MKLLLDENISWRIKKYLNFEFSDIIHISDLSIERLNDFEIWKYASENDCIIITHDSDFIDFVTLFGYPPKVIWLRTGNIRKVELANKINKQIPNIIEFYHNSEIGIFEIL